MKIRIVLAEDHTIEREGLCALINAQPNLELVAVAENGQEAIHHARTLLPKVIVMNVDMPKMNGIEATRHMVVELPNIKVVALSNHSDNRTIAEMIKAGAKGYLSKNSSFEELVHAISVVLDDKFYLSPGVAGEIIEDYLVYLTGKAGLPFHGLSLREAEILRFIANGQSAKQIALGLRLSTKTVEAHRRNIMDKLNIHNVADLTKYAIAEGLISLDPQHQILQSVILRHQ